MPITKVTLVSCQVAIVSETIFTLASPPWLHRLFIRDWFRVSDNNFLHCVLVSMDYISTSNARYLASLSIKPNWHLHMQFVWAASMKNNRRNVGVSFLARWWRLACQLNGIAILALLHPTIFWRRSIWVQHSLDMPKTDFKCIFLNVYQLLPWLPFYGEMWHVYETMAFTSTFAVWHLKSRPEETKTAFKIPLRSRRWSNQAFLISGWVLWKGTWGTYIQRVQ